MGRIDVHGKASPLQLTEDLNTRNGQERDRLTAKGEEFALVGERVLGQIGVTRCNFIRNFIINPELILP